MNYSPIILEVEFPGPALEGCFPLPLPWLVFETKMNTCDIHQPTLLPTHWFATWHRRVFVLLQGHWSFGNLQLTMSSLQHNSFKWFKGFKSLRNSKPKRRNCRFSGNSTWSIDWQNSWPNVKLLRLLGNFTSSKLWLKYSPKVRHSKVSGNLTWSKHWLK